MKWSAITLGVVVLFTLPAFGKKHESAWYGKTGNTLLEECKASVKLYDNHKADVDRVAASVCLAYITGVADSVAFAQSELPSPVFCIPANGDVSGIQLARIVVKYLEDHPGTLHRPAVTLTMEAFGTAFPCSKD